MVAIIALVFAVIIGLVTTIPKGDYSYLNGILMVIACILAFFGIGYAIARPQVGLTILAIIAVVIIIVAISRKVKKKASQGPKLSEAEKKELEEHKALIRTEFESWIMSNIDASNAREVEREKNTRTYAELSANQDYGEIKRQLIQKVKGGQYKIDADAVRLSFDYDNIHKYHDVLFHRRNDDYRNKKYLVTVSYKRPNDMYPYIEAIRALGKEDSIDIDPVAIGAGEIQHVPFSMVSTQAPLYFYFRLRCSVCYQKDA